MRGKIRLLVVPVLALAAAGCGSARIGQILEQPYRYQGRTVRVQGRVDRSFGAFIAGIYQVDDGTGRIYVLSNRPVPPKGAHVAVKGTVMNGVTVGPRAFGTVIQEEKHRFE